MDNLEKGLLYEVYIKNFILLKLNKNAYLWNECPENILIDNKLVHSHNEMRLIRKDIKDGFLHNHKDIGIDIVQINNNNISLVQCKNGYSKGLCVNDIAGIMMRFAFSRVPTYIYYTDCLSRNIKYTANISHHVVNIDCSNKIDDLLKINDNDDNINFIKLPIIKNKEKIIINSIEPYSYQIEAYEKFKEYFETEYRGILSLPPGTGKTYTSYLISKDYNQIILISPLKEFAYQNLIRFIEYGYDSKTLLVDSDGIRDINEIKEFIKDNNNFLISSTYYSVDLISECLDLFDKPLFIIDEFHNLSKANISDKNNDIYKLLKSNHKILFMSATPRIYDLEYDDNEEDNEEDNESNYSSYENLIGDIIYNMSFNEAISNKYITDYKLWLPSIYENNNNDELQKELSIYDIDNEIKNRCIFLYSCILNNGSRKIITYCKDTNDMNNIIDSFIKLNEFYNIDFEINSISCNDTNIKRKEIINTFSNNNSKIQLLFNIRILNECIDIPSCDSIYISYPPKNKITTVQRINRATRIDKNNPFKIANVYIWCNEYEEILETLSSIKEYDLFFKDKVYINKIDFYNNKTNIELKLIENDKILIDNYIIGIKEFKYYSWDEKLELVKDYIKENNNLPSRSDKNINIKSLGFWIKTQKHNYKNKKEIMKNEEIKNKWEEFIKENNKLFMTNEEIWNEHLDEVKNYIKENNKLPSKHKNKEIKKVSQWIDYQKNNYKNNTKIMKLNNEIKIKWEEFMKEYNQYFKTNEEIWKDNLTKVIEYIKENNNLPSCHNKNNEIRYLGSWIIRQKDIYKNNTNIMKRNNEIRNIWEEFIEEYEEFFKTNEEIWKDNLTKVIEYIKENNKVPSNSDNNKKIRYLGLWLDHQKHNYKNNTKIMKLNKEIRIKWEEFIKEYEEFFKTNEELWNENLNEVINYIKENNKLPSSSDKNINIKSLGSWIIRQKDIYKNNTQIMKLNNEIKIKWEEFMKEYNQYFKTNEELWNENLNEVINYIKENNKIPSKHKNNKIKSLGSWIVTQKQNYKNNKCIMKLNENIRIKWEKFIEEYEEFFKTNEEIWNENLNEVINYIKENNKLPSSSDKNINIKSLGSWIIHQKKNYKNNTQIMKLNNET
jgi:superfamily II DNA or RNA helicase